MTRYQLHPACRVRREGFGLLFYDLRGPRLLFAETADLLTPDSLEQGVSIGGPAWDRSSAQRHRVERLLSSLARKGFLREQPIC